MSASSANAVMLERIAELERELAVLRTFVAPSTVAGTAPEADPEALLLCYAGMRLVAVELESVAEVLPAAALMELPEGDPSVLGALNLRGTPLVVHDLARHLFGEGASMSRTDLILDCRHDGRRLGLKINDAMDVVHAVVTPLGEPGDDQPDGRMLRGVVVHEGEQVLVLNLGAFRGPAEEA